MIKKSILIFFMVWTNTKALAIKNSYILKKGEVLELDSLIHERLQIKKKGVVEISYIHEKKLWRIFPLRSGSVVIKRIANDGEVRDAFLVSVVHSKELDKKKELMENICHLKTVSCNDRDSSIAGFVESRELYSKIYKACQKAVGCQFQLKLQKKLHNNFREEGFYLEENRSLLLCNKISLKKFKKNYPELISNYPPSCYEADQNYKLLIKMELIRKYNTKDIELIDISNLSSQIINKNFLLETRKDSVELLSKAEVVTKLGENAKLEMGLKEKEKSIGSSIKLKLEQENFKDFSLKAELQLSLPRARGSANKIKVVRSLKKGAYEDLAIFSLNKSNSFQRTPLFLAYIPLISPFFRKQEDYTGESYLKASVMLKPL